MLPIILVPLFFNDQNEVFSEIARKSAVVPTLFCVMYFSLLSAWEKFSQAYDHELLRAGFSALLAFAVTMGIFFFGDLLVFG